MTRTEWMIRRMRRGVRRMDWFDVAVGALVVLSIIAYILLWVCLP